MGGNLNDNAKKFVSHHKSVSVSKRKLSMMFDMNASLNGSRGAGSLV